MSGRCADCRWWLPNPVQPPDRQPPQWGACRLASVGLDEPEHPTLAYGIGSHGDDFGLATHEDFGCIQYEPKVTPTTS